MFLNRIKRFLVSPKTSIILILFILAACIAGFTVPQITEKSPSFFEQWKADNIYTYRFITRLQLHRVFTSFWFLCAMGLTLVSIGYSLYLQIRKNIRKRSRSVIPDGKDKGLAIICKKIPGLDEIKLLFKKKGYHVKSLEGGTEGIMCSKNAPGRWGSTILHAGIFLVILSAFLVFAFQKRGFVQIIKGDTFSGSHSDFLVRDLGLFAGDFEADFTTSLLLLSREYYKDDEIKKLESIVLIDDKKGNRQREGISPVDTFDYNGIRIHQSYNYGYTLSFVLRKHDGEKVTTHFNLDMPNKKEEPLEGITDFPTTSHILNMKFYPDLNGQSFFITKPILYLTVSEMITNNVVFNGLLLPRQSVKIKDDILAFTGITEWSGLIFTKNPGLYLSFLGFTLIIGGAVIMFGFPYREVRTYVRAGKEGCDLSFSTFTTRYPATFDEEIKDIMEELS